MQSEQIIKIGKFVYSKLFDEFGYVKNDKYISFIEKDGKEYDCTQIFWRFYWVD